MSDDLDLLQGAWTITAMDMDGQTMPETMLGDARLVIEGSRFTSTGMGAVYEGTLKLDSSSSPAHLDMRFDAGPEKGNTNLGIYQLGRDSWKLCLATRGTVRPSTFASPTGSGIAVQTLARGKVAKARKGKTTAASKGPSGPATEFEGEWRMLSGVMNGAAMDASAVQWVKRVTRGNQTTVLAGPQTMLKVEFSFDPSSAPQSIDYLNLAGAAKGKRQQGIYRFEGDVLTVCTAPPGAARPAEFTSVPGDGRTLTTWKRA
jgi:uncharacterized protein (TIGR03067 family)